MRRQLLDIEQHQSMRLEDLACRQEREVRKVLMIDGVVLVVRHQLLEMRKLHRDDALFVEKDLHPGDEVVDVRHLRQYVVADYQIRFLASRDELSRRLTAEEFDERRDALGLGHSRHVGGWLDAEHRDLPRDKILKKYTVVARELDD
jgi:hypothetical protein